MDSYKYALTTALLEADAGTEDDSWWWDMAHELDEHRGTIGVPSIYA